MLLPSLSTPVNWPCAKLYLLTAVEYALLIWPFSLLLNTNPPVNALWVSKYALLYEFSISPLLLNTSPPTLPVLSIIKSSLIALKSVAICALSTKLLVIEPLFVATSPAVWLSLTAGYVL